MARYWENITRHVTTTIMGAVCILAAVALVVLALRDEGLQAADIVVSAILLGAGGYLLGATGLLSELSKFVAGANKVWALLKGRG